MKQTTKLNHTCLAAAVACMLAATAVHSQSTTGSIYGQATAGDGTTILIRGATGLSREINVDNTGHYSATQLPVGTYSVTLLQNGKAVQTRNNVTVTVNAGSNVSFAGEIAAKNLAGIQVTGNATPTIDVSTVDSRTVVTAQQLANLPLPRSAEAAALLAPGTVATSGGFTSTTGAPLVSFGGSSVEENAYYINGFNTTDIYLGQGGITLPYGSIDQEEVYTGGYSAQYGRSDGGVLNMIGKSGTNEWHFGGQYLYQPKDLRGTAVNTYYESGLPPSPVAGRLYSLNSRDSQWESVYDAYVGGPIIKDKLFFFASAEMTRSSADTVENVTAGTEVHSTSRLPKWYAKINWNITDKNLLELTGASSKEEGRGTVYNYDYATRQATSFRGYLNDTKTGGDLWTAKFTSYITDSLTFTAQYGKMKTFNYSLPIDYNSVDPYIASYTYENPAITNGNPNHGVQTIESVSNPYYNTSNLRLSLNYVIGDHSITAGIDNLSAGAYDQGSVNSGPGYFWSYGQTSDPNAPLYPSLGVGAIGNYPNGALGYYVSKNINISGANLFTRQRAQYIEDQWHVSDRWLLSLGLRNDGFTDYNSHNQPYMAQTKPQWAPRLGFSWDVNGDGSFKVFGNVGRYYLGSPLAPGGPANGYVSTQQYYTYSGIAANGAPTGLTQVSGPVSANNAFGQDPDPRTVTVHNLKAENQDEFILGFSKMLGSSWDYGAKVTRRILRHDIDDYCDIQTVINKAASMGITDVNNASCYYINPGQANTFAVEDPNGSFHNVTLTNAEMQFPQQQRKYYSLEAFLEHPFDGHWYGKIDYVFSRSYGNNEGMGETDAMSLSETQSTYWDFPLLMQYAGGPQGEDHTHQIKIFGYYQVTPEWMVSANVSLISGGPIQCLGFWGTQQVDPYGYGSGYQWCNGKPSAPGAPGRLPWEQDIDVGIHYRPAFAQHKLSLSVDVINLLNRQVPLNEIPQYDENQSPATPNPLYGTPQLLQQPRYVRLGVTYDY